MTDKIRKNITIALDDYLYLETFHPNISTAIACIIRDNRRMNDTLTRMLANEAVMRNSTENRIS